MIEYISQQSLDLAVMFGNMAMAALFLATTVLLVILMGALIIGAFASLYGLVKSVGE